MKVELDVLASTCIRRKKPWPRLAFVGHVQESLFLLDSTRLSVLYVPSGKTRRRIPKLHSLLSNAVILGSSDNGHFICGVLVSGDVFLWHKDTDLLRIIPAMPELADRLTDRLSDREEGDERLYMCMSGDGATVLVVLHCSDVYVWQLRPGVTIFDAAPADVTGRWSRVGCDDDGALPGRGQAEACVHAVFCINDRCVSALTCVCSLVFTRVDSVCVSTLFLRWPTLHARTSSHGYTAAWKTHRYPFADLSPGDRPTGSGGVTYVARHTHDTQLLAVAVNRGTSHAVRMTYVHPGSGTMVSASMKGCGAREAVSASSYAILDMEWTHDDLFLVCVTGQGSMCVLTRLGEPVLLHTQGCSMEMGPKLYLPLHPIIVVRACGTATTTSAESPVDTRDAFQQRFSVATHPYLPIILCSDGYMVTIMQLSRATTYVSLMYDLVVESRWHLEQVNDDTRMQKARRRTTQLAGVTVAAGVDVAYQFEPQAEVDSSHEDDDVDGVSALERAMQHLDGGRIEFGNVDNMNTTLNHSEFDMSGSEHIDMAIRGVSLAWNLAASHVGLWTAAHEDVVGELRETMLWLFEVLLRCSSDTLLQLDRIQECGSQKDGLTKVLNLFITILNVLKFDNGFRHLLVCAIKLVHVVVDVLLHSGDSKRTKSCLTVLHRSCALLRFSEVALCACYNRPPIGAELATVDEEPHKISTLTPDADSCVHETREANDTNNEATDVKQLYSDNEQSQGISKRLRSLHRFGVTWRLLYKTAVVLHRKLTDKPSTTPGGQEKAARKRAKKCLRLITWLQKRLRVLNIDIPMNRTLIINSGAELSINGQPLAALHAWVQELEELSDSKIDGPKGDALLHSILFSLLLQGRLRSAVEFVEFLLRTDDVRRAVALWRKNWQTEALTLPVLHELPMTEGSTAPVYIQNRSVRHVVQSLARVMASYFINSTLYVFPPHAPKRIPPLHTHTFIASRVVPLDRDHMTAIVRRDQLDDVWTTERVLQYLMLSGLLPEAVWLTRELGDWKSAFVMGVAWSYHHQVAAKVYKRRKSLQLPTAIQPQSIIRDHLCTIFQLPSQDDIVDDAMEDSVPSLPLVVEANGMDQLKHCLGDLLLAATISHVSTVPWLLESLGEQLGNLCRRFEPLVPDGLYLPAPPVYCPQPATVDKTSLSQPVLSELSLRQRVSSVIRLTLLVLDSSATMLPSSRWYIQKVIDAFSKSQKSEVIDRLEFDIEILHDGFLSRPSDFEGHESDADIHVIIGCFRELCTIVWMLYVRDELSLALRRKAVLLQRKLSEGDVAVADWETHCRKALTWAEHLIPFSHYLRGETILASILISLVIELPLDGDSARLLARHFYDVDRLEAGVQDKMQWVLKEWQGVFVNGKHVESDGIPMEMKHGKTLSSCYQKIAQKMDSSLRRKRKLFGEYHEQVFANMAASSGYGSDSETVAGDAAVCVGSRPMESQSDYLRFLDLFYAVSFNEAVGSEREKQRLCERPLLVRYSDEVRNNELNSLSNQVIGKLQRRETTRSGVSPHRPPLSPRRSGSNPERHSSATRGKFTEKQVKQRAIGGTRFLERRHSTEELMKHMKTSSPRVQTELRRRRSFTDLSPRRKDNRPGETAIAVAKSSGDPLAELLLQPWLLDKMTFGSGYDQLEQLLDWFGRWSGHSHAIHSGVARNDMKPVIRVRVQPRTIMYSLWLLENCYYPSPTPVRGSTDITVNMLRSSELACSPAVPSSAVAPPSGSAVNDSVVLTTAEVGRKQNNNKNNKDRKVKGKPSQSSSSTPFVDTSSSLFDPVTVTSLTQSRARVESQRPVRRLRYDDEVDIAVDLSEDSAGTLNVSSLRGVELRETVEQTLMKLTNSSTKESNRPRKEGSSQAKGKKAFNRTLPLPQDKTPTRSRRTKGEVVPVEHHAMVPVGQRGCDPADIAQAMQHMVRSELRKIFQAQQQGVVAMLNALNTDPTTETVSHSPSRSTMKASSTPRRQPDLTDSDAATIQSDDSLFLRSPPYDKPLTVSQLADSESAKSPGRGGVTHALRELRLLEGDQGSHGMIGKENRPVGMPSGVEPSTGRTGAPLRDWNGVPLLGISRNYTPEYVNVAPTWSDRPTDVYSTWASTAPRIPLLHLNGSSYGPSVLTLNVASGGPGYFGGVGLPRLPPPPPPAVPRFIIPTQRAPLFSMPLLHLSHNEKQFVHIENDTGVPCLIPPQEIIAYEHSRYGAELLPRATSLERPEKHHSAQQQIVDRASEKRHSAEPSKQRSSRKQRSSTPQQGVSIGGKLLLVDVEPFSSRDNRDSRKRIKRRLKKSDLSNAVAQRLSETPRKKHGKKRSKSKTPQRGKSGSRTPGSSRSRTPTGYRSRIPERSRKSRSRTHEGTRSRTTTKSRSGTPDRSMKSRSKSPKNRKSASRSRTPKRGRSRTPRRHKKSPKTGSRGLSPGLDDEPVKLDEGYALARGLFDHFLNKEDDVGTVADTNASIQYRAVTGTTQPICRDVAVETEDSMTGHYPTRDTGVSSVADGLRRYYRTEAEDDDMGANILAPDIFLNLKFAGASSQDSADQPKKSDSQGFINVVDIAGDLLEEIISPGRRGQTKNKGKTSPPRHPLSPSFPSRDRSSPRTADVSPGRHRVSQPRRDYSPQRDYSPHHRGRSQSPKKLDTNAVGAADPVTVNLLDTHPTLEEPWLDALKTTGQGQEKTKAAIRERLRNMNLQFSAIDEMSHQIEQDFRSARSVLNTIEQLGVMSRGTEPQDSAPRSPDALVLQRVRSPQHPMSDDSPRHPPSSGSREHDSARQAWTSDHSHHGGSDSGHNDLDEDLSGVSSILGEIFVKGHLRAEDLGLTQEAADRLARKADPGRRHTGKGRHRARSREEQTQLRDWMGKKRAEQSKEYRRELDGLRERETRPYQPGKTSPKRAACRDVPAGGSSGRHAKLRGVQQESYHKRQRDATKLMNEILNERPQLVTKVADPTVDDKTMGETRKIKQRNASPSTRGRTGMKAGHRITSARRHRLVSPATAGDRKHRIAEAWLEQHGSESERDQHQDVMKVTVDTRTRVVHPRDLGVVAETPTTLRRPQRAVEVDDDACPYTDLVNVQHPETMRQERRGRPEPKTYAARLSQLQPRHGECADHATRESLERLYGTTRLPGSYKENERQAPRLVKTYTERLKEMKRQHRPYHKPPQARQRVDPGGVTSHIPVTRHQAGRPRKTLTYAQQLQLLQPSRELAMTEGTLQRHAIRRSRRPPHKPKTYSQMLQELQKPATVTWAPREHFKPYGGTIGHHTPMQYGRYARVRPYADPYSETCDDDADDDTLVSHWSVDDRVKKLLYDDDELSAAATDYDISEISEVDARGLPLTSYTDLVDVDQLADVGSLGSGSVLSFIDWDQIDHLLQDVSTDRTGLPTAH